MNEFQVPTRPVAVQVFLADGEHLSGRMFLAEDPRVSGSTALLVSALNDARDFLPFEVCDDRSARSLVLNKDHIVRVRVVGDGHDARKAEGELPGNEPEAIPAAGEAAILHLSDGSRISGRVAVETPASLSRTVDKLNCAPRFLPVVVDDGVDVVQRCHVTALD